MHLLHLLPLDINQIYFILLSFTLFATLSQIILPLLPGEERILATKNTSVSTKVAAVMNQPNLRREWWCFIASRMVMPSLIKVTAPLNAVRIASQNMALSLQKPCQWSFLPVISKAAMPSLQLKLLSIYSIEPSRFFSKKCARPS